MKTLLLAGIAAILAVAVATADASGPVAEVSGKRPRLISNCLKAKYKPINVIIACGDASFGAQEMTWSSWTRKTALGTGTGRINDCDPDCVHGTTKTAPIQLLLSHPRTCSNGWRLFTQLRYTWTSGSPLMGPSSASVPLGCKLSEI